jgi:hypothetical protein
MKQREPCRSPGPQCRGNPLHPDLMSPTERLDEVARLLALGFLRLALGAKPKNQMNRTT